MNARHALYILISIGSTAAAWWHGIAWIGEGGNLLLMPTFFIDAYRGGSAAAFLTIDILAAWATFMFWVVPDAARVGLGARKGWLFLALSFIGTCFAFPLYLVVRERHLAKSGRPG